jgi:hypothetical protein
MGRSTGEREGLLVEGLHEPTDSEERPSVRDRRGLRNAQREGV